MRASHPTALRFLFRPTPLGRALGLAAVLLSLAVLFLDHFSEERAAQYHGQILDALGPTSD